MRYTFHKLERLKKETVISQLYSEGQSFGMYPLRIIWLETELNTPFPAQFVLSVPKRKFPKAAHRNRIKRQMREALRLQKHLLTPFLQKNNAQCAIMLLYTAKEPLPYQLIEEKLHLSIKKLKTNLYWKWKKSS